MLLIGAATNLTVIADVKKMTEGAPDAVAGSIAGGRGSIYAKTTDDDRLLFVAEENGESITVIDLERARRNGYGPDAVIGKVPVRLSGTKAFCIRRRVGKRRGGWWPRSSSTSASCSRAWD